MRIIVFDDVLCTALMITVIQSIKMIGDYELTLYIFAWISKMISKKKKKKKKKKFWNINVLIL